MKICHIAPLVEPLGDQAPGGSEHLVRLLSAGQAARGHQVSVIGATGSRVLDGVELADAGVCGGRLVPIRTGMSEEEQSARTDLDDVFEAEAEVFEPVKKFLAARGGDFDAVHNHAYDFYPLFSLEDLGLPLLHTLHLPPLLPWVNERLRTVDARKLVCVSESAARLYAERTGVSPRVIPCGLPLEHIREGLLPEDFFLWVGRISPEKGLHTAVSAVCDRLGARLVAIGRIYDENYFRSIEAQLAHPLVSYLGALPNVEVLDWMRRAAALVLPLEWDEPFGLVMIEALASGTPVIAFARGAAPEIIQDGENGFLVSGADELAAALRKTKELDRRKCRPSVERRYSLGAMVSAYEEAYRAIPSPSPRTLPNARS